MNLVPGRLVLELAVAFRALESVFCVVMLDNCQQE
jgi:hypothetical protein